MSLTDADLEALDPRRRLIVERVVGQKRANTKLRFSRREARELRGVSESKQISDEAAGKVLAYRSDGRVWIDPGSLYDALIRDVIESLPPSGPRARVRKAPTSAFQKKKTPRSPAQLAALQAHREELRRQKEARETEPVS
jgi:hypothetical protein